MRILKLCIFLSHMSLVGQIRLSDLNKIFIFYRLCGLDLTIVQKSFQLRAPVLYRGASNVQRIHYSSI